MVYRESAIGTESPVLSKFTDLSTCFTGNLPTTLVCYISETHKKRDNEVKYTLLIFTYCTYFTYFTNLYLLYLLYLLY